MNRFKKIAHALLTIVTAVAFVFLLPGMAFAADPTRDASTAQQFVCGNAGGCTVSFTLSHTIGAGAANGVIVIGLCSITITITGVTSPGMTFTLADTSSSTGDASTCKQFVAPTGSLTGAKTLTVAFTGTMSLNQNVSGQTVSVFNVDQTNPVDVVAHTNNGASGSTFNTNITTTKDKDFLVDVIDLGSTATAPTVDASQTQVQNITCDGGASKCGSSYKTALKTPAGATFMKWTYGIFSATWTQSVVALEPVQSSGSGNHSAVYDKSAAVFNQQGAAVYIY